QVACSIDAKWRFHTGHSPASVDALRRACKRQPEERAMPRALPPGATPRSRLRRRPDRGAYDFTALAAVLDAQPLVHVGYLLQGRPFVTPTLQWREGERVYWHGSAASRMLKAVAGQPVCLTVSLWDGLVLARSGFNHSVN